MNATRRRRRSGFSLSNLIYPSEGLKAAMASATAGVTDAAGNPFAAVGLSNGFQFAALAQADSARPFNDRFIASLPVYNISVYVIMDDLSAPVVSANTTSGDFCLAVDGGVVTSGLVTTLIGSNIYRVSGSKAPAAMTTNSTGVFRFATQTGKGFKVIGFQLTLGASLQPYFKTTAGPGFL